MVAIDGDGLPSRIVGYYAILPHEFRGEELPDPFRKGTRVGNLSAVPGALLAQLGVDNEFKGRGVAKMLVRHALLRVVMLAEQWGCVAVVTDPLDDIARNLYSGFDFVPLNHGSLRTIVPAKTVVSAFKKAGFLLPLIPPGS